MDDEDWVWAQDWLWTWHRDARHRVYASREVRVHGQRLTIWLHKEILRRMRDKPSPDHQIGDHMNGRSLDNRRCNLRWATVDENNRNRYGFYHYQQRLAL